MKTSSVSLLLLTAGLFAVPALAQNEMKPAEGTGNGMKKNYEELIRKYDKNGDGKLDEDEKAAAHAAMRKEGGGEADRYKEALQRFDKDGDGKLNDAERAEAEKVGALIEKYGGRVKFRAQRLKHFDKDGDGKLSDAELAEEKRFRAEQVRKFDKNGDGHLDDTEREEALKAFMAEENTKAPAGLAMPAPEAKKGH